VNANERVTSVARYPAPGFGQTVIQVVVGDDTDSRAFVVDEDGVVTPTHVFWKQEEVERRRRFGRMTPRLFEQQAPLEVDEQITVEIFVRADVPEPQLPFDGTDTYVSIDEYETWLRDHATAQVARVVAAKSRVLAVLAQHGASVLANPRGLPTIRARVSAAVLRSTELNAPDVVEIDIDEPPDGMLMGHAGRASMASLGPNADNPPHVFRAGLTGGMCGGPCDGGLIDVGLLEKALQEGPTFSGLARNNARIVGANTQVTGYFDCPTSCSSDDNCPDAMIDSQLVLKRFCREPTPGAPKICVQDHLTWVAASLGMVGSYAYNSTVPAYRPNAPFGNLGAECTTTAQCPSGHECLFHPPSAKKKCHRVFPSTGTSRVDFRIGNEQNANIGLDFLITQGPESPTKPCQLPFAPPTPYVNRSQGGISNAMNFAGRAFGTFLAVAAGNKQSGPVVCAQLKNGICVGSFDYANPGAYDDMANHKRTDSGGGSSFLNDTMFDEALERPHLLGPGNLGGVTQGLHMPAIDVSPGGSQMRTAAYPAPNQPAAGEQIRGTSFATPAVLSAAIQAHQFEGWFSALAYPMVNKAILLAATRDANADGAIGKASVWSANAPTVDAEDGAGQIRFDRLQPILVNNRYYWNDLADASFVSCGANCRKVTVATVTIPSSTPLRVALAWQTCMVDSMSIPSLNDLDLALVCDGSVFTCGGTILSNTVTSELEMLEKAACTYDKTCEIQIRIKNGAPLASCGSTTTERVGVAWSFGN
jgi:hypothetical protein